MAEYFQGKQNSIIVWINLNNKLVFELKFFFCLFGPIITSYTFNFVLSKYIFTFVSNKSLTYSRVLCKIYECTRHKIENLEF